MKYIPLAFALFVTGLLPAGAVNLDAQAFGASLNGWRKDRTAVYSLNNNAYRTHIPTATRTRRGGLFISTRIEEATRRSGSAVAFLELTFTPGGQLASAQIRATIAGKRLDSGLVTRQPEPVVPLPEEGAPPVPVDWQTPTSKLINELFTRFDAELNKLDPKEDEKPRGRDIFGRLRGTDKRKDIPAAVRHNLNLLLASVGHGRGYYHK